MQDDDNRLSFDEAPDDPVIAAQMHAHLTALELRLLHAMRPPWIVIWGGVTALLAVLGFIYTLAIGPIKESMHDQSAQVASVQESVSHLQAQVAQLNEAVLQLGKRMEFARGQR
jgi:hypothetical protein